MSAAPVSPTPHSHDHAMAVDLAESLRTLVQRTAAALPDLAPFDAARIAAARDTLRLIHVTCDACGEARATMELADGVVCAPCAESILEPEPPYEEQPGSRCSTGCGWCGRCS